MQFGQAQEQLPENLGENFTVSQPPPRSRANPSLSDPTTADITDKKCKQSALNGKHRRQLCMEIFVGGRICRALSI
jgi:hypothetical protein